MQIASFFEEKYDFLLRKAVEYNFTTEQHEHERITDLCRTKVCGL